MIKAAKILGIDNSNFRGNRLVLSPFREIKKGIKEYNLSKYNLSNCVITQLDGEDLSNMDLHGSIISANELYGGWKNTHAANNTKFNGANLKGTIFVGDINKCSFKGTNLKQTIFMKMNDRLYSRDNITECDFRYSTKLNIREYTQENSIRLDPYKGIFWELIPDEELISKYSHLDIHPMVTVKSSSLVHCTSDPTFGPLAQSLMPLAGEDYDIDYLQDGSSQVSGIKLSDDNLSRLALLVMLVSGYENLYSREQRELLMTIKFILDDEYSRGVFENAQNIRSILDYSYDEDPYGGARWNFRLAVEKYMSIEGDRQAHNWGFYSAIMESGPYTAIKR